jgi:hypothetical protein
MKIEGSKIEFLSAKIHYEFGECCGIRQTVDLVLLVDGEGRKIYQVSENTDDLRQKCEDFSAGKTITELSI